MIRGGRLLCLAAALALAVSAPAAAQPTPDAATAVLKQSGVHFPERVGPFVLQRIGSVGEGRADAHSEMVPPPAGRIVFDAYLSASDRDPAVELAETEPMVASLMQNLQPVRVLAAPSGAPGAAGKLWKGVVRGEPVYTAMMISRRGPWRIKLRATVAASLGDKGVAMVEQAFRDYPWWGAANARTAAAH
jgi:hypothetical protein